MRKTSAILIACLLFGCATQQSAVHNPEMEWIYTGDLHKALRAATRLRVYHGGASRLPEHPGKTVIEFTARSELNEVLKHLRFERVNSRWYDMCAGGPTFEWYVGTNLIAKVSLHHGQGMRWADHWDGDGTLTAESSDWIVDWLDKHGFPKPKKELESSRRAANKSLNSISEDEDPADPFAF